ncbi:hypothetical protein N9D31_04160, partial [Oligoflexaceae bacterium]|nr:hypothetical protein [Oligoflexaceae bacterium]
SGRVSSCVHDNRKKSFGVSAEDAHKDFTAISKSSYLPKIHLHAYRETINYTGRAEVKRVVRHVKGSYLKWSNEPKISINLSAIERSNKDLGADSASDSLAGTIIHEFLHQMGHSHPSGYNDGNYITVVGDCVASNGARARNTAGFGLTGSANRLFKYGPK